jgi:beta-lactamase class C
MKFRENRRTFRIFIIAISALFFTGAVVFQDDGEAAVPARVSAPDVSRPASAISILADRYDSLLKVSMAEINTVGAAVTVVKDGKVAMLKPYGVKKEGTSELVDVHTIFRMASVSKGFAGVLAGLLHRDGIVRLDDPVKNYIPGFRLKDSINTNHLTVRNLLSHTSGLVPHAYDNLVEDKVPFDKIIESLDQVDIAGPPGKYYGYQNVVYSLYAPVVKNKTSFSYGRLLQDSVFKPLNMSDASTGFESFRDNPDKAFPHARGRHQFYVRPFNNRYYSTLPAAGVNASISDLSQWLLALLGNQPEVLDNQVLDTVFKPEIVTPLKWVYLHDWDGVTSKQYALGWRVVEYRGHRILYHGGFVDGYKVEIALCREADFGVAYVTNSPDGRTSNWIPEFLNMYFETFSEKSLLAGTQAIQANPYP